ncbi:glycyl-radical enzyme activating protein [uncultured Mailhella sp.]|uniref:glycyl-radical enzyme activating protein n=1 Tax=uncultured Mailhella sp. TaxID=1981031 RepID=UPI0025E4F6EF|nr:glycyl-radical enzyme activating protein [uncultured Mailhella sp.]
MTDEKTSGLIFNVQKFSVHDGEGIRTLVFFKGCPLRCRWCSNPESQNAVPELSYSVQDCLHCGTCAKVCTRGAIRFTDGTPVVQRQLCRPEPGCLCTRTCPGGALGIYGKTVTAGELLRQLLEDQVFYVRSGGGVTLGGGEPLHQPDFALAVLRLARRARLMTNIETCGQTSVETMLSAAALLDTMFMDIKCMDPDKHRAWTGVSNERILENFVRVREAFPRLPITIRTPVIPGFNDNAGDIEAIARFVRRFSGVRHELLPYHRYGEQKYLRIGRRPGMGEASLPEETFATLREVAEKLHDDQL